MLEQNARRARRLLKCQYHSSTHHQRSLPEQIKRHTASSNGNASASRNYNTISLESLNLPPKTLPSHLLLHPRHRFSNPHLNPTQPSNRASIHPNSTHHSLPSICTSHTVSQPIHTPLTIPSNPTQRPTKQKHLSAESAHYTITTSLAYSLLYISSKSSSLLYISISNPNLI